MGFLICYLGVLIEYGGNGFVGWINYLRIERWKGLVIDSCSD